MSRERVLMNDGDDDLRAAFVEPRLYSDNEKKISSTSDIELILECEHVMYK